MKEFGSMDEVVEAVKKIITQEGLDLNRKDNIAVNTSVERFEVAGIFLEIIKGFGKELEYREVEIITKVRD
jgi:hypothetical protein